MLAPLPFAQPALPAALDAAALGRLQELDPTGERGVVRLILSTFEAALRKAIGELAVQRGDADPRIVFGLAHSLKSSSASVGAMGLSAACAQIEATLRPSAGGAPATARSGSTLDHLIARIEAEADMALRMVQTALSG